MTMTPSLFREVMGGFATGVTVVTTRDASGLPYGVTVNSFTSVSLRPPLVLVCLDNRLSGLDAFLGASRFAVNILGEDQRAISDHFATRGTDRSQAVDAVGATGIPVISGSLAVLECGLADSHLAGDHTILLGRVEAASVASDARERRPLLYFRGAYRGLRPE